MRILVVDDHAMVAEGIKMMLGRTHQISLAATGTEALTEISSRMPDLILLDNQLPDIDGVTLLKVIQALPERPPVIMISGFDNQQLAQEAEKLGAAGFIHKSLQPDALLAAIESVLNGQSLEYENASETGNQGRRDFNRTVADQLGMTERQLDVLQHMAKGEPNKVIARNLGIAESTVKTHIKAIFHMLQVNNRVACHNKALELGLYDSH